ncbi:MAG: hypothetical protein DRJ44_00135 [Thermoprotei archaeon]|nr:MAG: hypothetical protein DRJ44_00135 [Thermoprotei archaeon]
MKNVKIIVDSREAVFARQILKVLKELKAEIEIKKLKVGDYVLSEDVAVERKTVIDFVETLTRRNLFEQIYALKEVYVRPILILEGYLGVIRKFSKINTNSVLGALAALARNGISVIPTIDARSTASLLYFIARQEQIGESRQVAVRPVKKFVTVQEQQIFFLAGLPLIGRSKAISILKKFGTPLNALNNYRLWSKRISGIGENTVRKIEQVLTSKFEEGEEEFIEL